MNFVKTYCLTMVLAVGGCVSATVQDGNSAPVSQDNTKLAVSAFMEACVKTANNPNMAHSVLEKLGFRSAGTNRGDSIYRSSFAEATISPDSRSPGQAGQCVVTPKSSNFSTVVAHLNSAIPSSGVPATKLGGEEAWVLGRTGSLALVSRRKGAMARTQPNVYRR